MRSSPVQAIEKTNTDHAASLAGRPYVEAEQWAAIDAQQIISMWRRRKKVMVATLLAVLCIAGIYAFTARPVYESQATIELDTQTGAGGGQGPLGIIDLLSDTGARSVETQVAILQGRPLRSKALKRLSPAERTVASRYLDIRIAGVGTTDLVKIAVRSFDRNVSQKTANNLCLEYIKDTLQQNRAQVRGARVYVEDQRRKQLALLNQAQIRLANFKKQNETFDLATQSQALVARMSLMQGEAENARSGKLAAMTQLQRLRRDVSLLPDSTKVPQTITRSPQVEAIKSQLTQLEIDLLKAQQEYTANDPVVNGLKTQIANLRRQLSSRVEFETSTYANVPNAVKGGMLQKIAELQGEVLSNEARGIAVKRAIESAKDELRVLPDREYRLGRLIQDATGLQQAYTLLNDQYLNLKIQEQAKVPTAQTQFPAEGAALVAPNKTRILMLALPFGVMLAFLLAAFMERLDGRIHSDNEAERATGLPVIAHIPEMPRETESKLLGASATQSNFQLSESFQMLRTSIAFSVYDKPIRSILVTSSLPGEGKSTCAVNLAIAAAQSGEKVILVDCDLRRPTAHRLLKLSNRVGFTNVVAGSATLDEALQETSIPGLRLLASGPTPPNPYRLLHSRGARELLDQLRNEADFVIIDTPPALGMADAQVIASSSDAILLVVSTKGAKKDEISRTCDVLSQTNVEVLGLILNRVESSYGGYYGQETFGDYALPNTDNTSETHQESLSEPAQLSGRAKV